MDVAELRAKIKSNEVPNFLAFTGDEWAVQKIYIDQIAERNHLEKTYMDTVYEIIPKLGNKSFVANNNKLYLVRDDNKFLKDENGWAKVEDLLGNNILILLITKLDKRVKFASRYKDTIIEFNPLTPENLKKYMQKTIYNLTDKTCDKLIEACEGNYGRILLELDKVIDYWQAVNTDTVKTDENTIIDRFLKDGTIYTPPKDAIFDLVDAILDRKAKLTFELLEQCKAIGESSFAILTVLFNNAKAVLQVQTCTKHDVAKSTGLTGWQVMNAKKHLNKYSNKELEFMLKFISNVVHGIKVGTIEEQYVLEYILVRIL